MTNYYVNIFQYIIISKKNMLSNSIIESVVAYLKI